MAETAKNGKQKKYIARKFIPKAYYSIFDWENYIPGQSYDTEVGPDVERNPLADPSLCLKKQHSEEIVNEDIIVMRAAAKASDSIRLRIGKEVKSEVFESRRDVAAAYAASKDVSLRLGEENESEKQLTKNVAMGSDSELDTIFGHQLTMGTDPKLSNSRNSSDEDFENTSESHKSEKTKNRVCPLNSISARMIGIISSLIIVSLVGITFLVSYLISKDTRVNAEDNNLNMNSRTAVDTENRLNNLESSIGMLLDLLEQSESSESEQRNNASLFFERNGDIAGVVLPASQRIFLNNSYFAAHELDTEIVSSFAEGETDVFEKAGQGTVILENASPIFGTPVIAYIYPVSTHGEDNVIMVLYSAENLYESYTSSAINESFLVNANGEVIIHPDWDITMESPDFSGMEIVKTMLNSKTASQQLNFISDGEEYLGAYKKFSNGCGGVITTVKTSVILEAVRRTTIRNIFLTFAILSIAIMIVYFFSKSISSPLKSLTKVANEINRGNFNTDAFDELPSKRKDEVGILIQSTRNERQILNTFTKMTNRGVTEAIITKKIDFDPHLKDITIFFSDIRGFTEISDGFKKRFKEKSAGEIINFLNDYVSRMVNCITITGGNVDKFEGDAIMACWGVLRHDSLEFETMDDSNPEKAKLKKIHDDHVKEDAINAIRATVAMRYSLAVYNKDAMAFTIAHEDDEEAKYKPHIRIGSGLNSGRATVGFMGSEDKMEFTSIGDAVNLASRTESSNKPCGTDILITEDTYNLLKTDYIRCEENNFTISPENSADEIVVEMIPATFEVKGKGRQHFYGVVNMPAFDIEGFFKKTDPDFKIDEECAMIIGPEGPASLHEVRYMLGIPEPDFGGVNLDEEENKIQIQTN